MAAAKEKIEGVEKPQTLVKPPPVKQQKPVKGTTKKGGKQPVEKKEVDEEKEKLKELRRLQKEVSCFFRSSAISVNSLPNGVSHPHSGPQCLFPHPHPTPTPLAGENTLMNVYTHILHYRQVVSVTCHFHIPTTKVKITVPGQISQILCCPRGQMQHYIFVAMKSGDRRIHVLQNISRLLFFQLKRKNIQNYKK